VSHGNRPLVGADWLRLRHRVFAAEYESMVQRARLPRGALLDAGCGAGTHLSALRHAAGENGAVFGCDIEPANVEAARDAARDAGESYRQLDVADLTSLPYEDGCFDGVWCANVLQYLDDAAADAALRELLRVLRPGGVIALKDVDMLLWRMHPGDPLLMARLVAAQSAGSHPVPSVRGRLLRRMLEAAGATNVRQETVLLERWAPLHDEERRMYQEWLRQLAGIARAAGVGEADSRTWQWLAGSDAADHPLRADDCYICEGQVLASGRRA
jgi:ubiquinone/menaquinone biosynthesis C-methylase UbiE